MAAVDAAGGAIFGTEEKPFEAVRKGYTAFMNGDVILAKITPCFENGKAAIARKLTSGHGFGSSEFHVFRGTGAVLPEYLFHFLRQPAFRKEAADHMTGTAGQARVPVDYVRQVPLPVPPLAEQHRIVAAVEALLARVNAARDRLAKVPAILKRFRQAVLAAACSGRLTEEWRAARPAITPAGDAMRTQLARRHLAGKGKSRRLERGYVGGHDVQDADGASELPDVPDSWCWAPLGLLGEDPLAPVQTGPFGAQLHRSEFVPSGVPVIAVGNLGGLTFSRDGLYYITLEKAAQLRRFAVHAGDLLFARSGATLGKVCVAPAYVHDWRMTGHILRARLHQALVLPEVVAYALWGSPPVLREVADGIRGVTRPGYNTALLEGIRIPMPPIEEQREILRLVEVLFALADTIEQRVAAATTRAEKIPQAILSRAFSGQLVPTELELAQAEGRTYESAASLLERIQREGPDSQPGIGQPNVMRRARVRRY
jgi:type I restriction enzyme S subunit